MILKGPIPDAGDGVIYFPVRHHSPASARFVVELIERVRPTAVLIEGPVDFNPRFDELLLAHELPIAIYAYVRLSDDTRRSAFYPFLEYSPEWQALLAGKRVGACVEFIDLAWERMAEVEHAPPEENRYSDRHFRVNPYPETLAKRLQLSGFDEVWDVLFELDADLTLDGYMERAQTFCTHLRYFSGPESDENAAREDFMASQIARHRDAGDGPVVVVTGGFHSAGLFARLGGHTLETHPPDDAPLPRAQTQAPNEPAPLEDVSAPPEPTPPPYVIDQGITLTPFTYERIDRMNGYAAGLLGPAFYEYVWQRRRDQAPLDGRTLLHTILSRLRQKGQLASTADFVAVETMARSLAHLRGRREVWRTDILDALSGALVKEPQDAEYMHPVLLEARMVFRGTRRGVVSKDASLPPLVHQARSDLDRLGLTLPEKRDVRRLNLEDPVDVERSQTLHRLRALGVSGVYFRAGTDFVRRNDLRELFEEWELLWLPEFEGDLIEASVYGADLGLAAAGVLLETAHKDDIGVAAIAALAVDATVMGLAELAIPLFDRIEARVREAADFFETIDALAHLLFLTHHGEILSGGASPQSRRLLTELYQRALWLFESLGIVKERDQDVVRGAGVIFDTHHTTFRDEAEHHDEFVGVFGRIGDAPDAMPLARGCGHGGVFALGRLDTSYVLDAIQGFVDPMELGDYLVGFFSLAREAAQQDPRLMALLDDLVSTLPENDFLEMLPGLRLAFTFFTPLEKHRLADGLFAAPRRAAMPEIDAAARLRGESLNARVQATLRAFGLRRPEDPTGSQATGLEGQATSPNGSQTSGLAGQSPSPNASQTSGLSDTPHEPNPRISEQDRQIRWQLILGAEASSDFDPLDGAAAQRERLLGFLYDREYGPNRNVRHSERSAGLGESQMTVPDWINGVHSLFPKRTIERLERDALDRYQLEEIVTRPEILRRAQPNLTLLKAVLRTQHLMNQEVLAAARELIRRVVEELIEKLSREIRAPFLGALDRRRRSFLKVAKNFDAVTTIQRNLKHFDPNLGKLVIHDPFFYSRIRRQVDRWRIIILVDQSGSMVDSVIHAAVTAAIFHKLNQVQTHLVAFDTSIIDLTQTVDDPVETLLKVQLGGGTDICNALLYAAGLIDDPRRTIVVLISDFFEGGPPEHLIAAAKGITDGGTHLLGLAALDRDANPNYDRQMASQLVAQGAHVAAMTPGELAAWIAEKVR